MIGAVLENIIGGYLHPRASVRRLLNGGHGIEAALSMVLLAWILREMFLILMPGGRPANDTFWAFYYLRGLIDSLITFGLFSLAVCYVGRLFGGKADFQETGLVIAWYLLVTSIIVPVVLPAVLSLVESARAGGEAAGGAGLVVVASSAVMLWLLSSYIAELHRFRRTWMVLAVLLGISVVFSVLLTGLLPVV